MCNTKTTPPGNLCQQCGKRLGNIVPGGRWHYWMWEDEAGRRSLAGYCHDYDCRKDLDEDDRKERMG